MENTTLIPATNFEVKKINSKMPFKTATKAGHLIIDGFAIWDKSANAWVSVGSDCPLTGVPVPTRYTRKWVAEELISRGLYSGFNHVSPSSLK